MINGESVKPKTGNSKDRILNMTSLLTVLRLILFCLKVITKKVNFKK